MKLYLASALALLAGCGGGDGSSSSSANSEDSVTRYRSDYAASDLQGGLPMVKGAYSMPIQEV